MKRVLLWFLALVLLLTGCTQTPNDISTSPEVTTVPTVEPDSPDFSQMTLHANPDELFSKRDYDASVSGGTQIVLNGTAIQCTGTGVTVSGSTATITQEGTYILSGNLTNGSIRVDTDKNTKVQLVLDNVRIHSETSAPICILQADKVFVTLVGSSELTCGSSFAASSDGIDGALFSKDDLTINGSGSLCIKSPGGHGIVSKNDLTITDGSITVTAAKHGIVADDSLCIASGNFVITAGKDALQADSSEEGLGFVYIRGGQFQLDAVGDGISATSTLQIDGGVFQVTTGGGSSNGETHTDDMFGYPGGVGGFGGRPGFGGPGNQSPPQQNTEDAETDSVSSKGLKAGGDLLIRAGDFTLNCADDALHSKANATVIGGNCQVRTGDDAFHAASTLTVSGGTLTVTESYEGMEAQSIHIHGGTITLKTSDDGLNAAGGNDQSGFQGRPGGDMFISDPNCSITVTGGVLKVDASGDGIDSNGNLIFTGGYTVVEGPTGGGNGPLDYGGTAVISGGTLVVTGSVQMAQPIQPEGQGALNVRVNNQSAGTDVTITDAEGNVVLTFTPAKAFACVIVSTPKLISGQTYHLVAGNASGDVQAD